MSGDDDALRHALAPTVAHLLQRHRTAAREWLPHEWVPWSRGRDYAGPSGTPWTPAQSTLGPAAQAALALNLLTEDNLPSYHRELVARTGDDGPWGAWARRWTAEESRHATALRDYALLARAIDPVQLERERLEALELGWSAAGRGLLRAMVYAALQERATSIAHRRTGRAIGDPVAVRLLARIAADEHLHMLFYRDLVAAAFEKAPTDTLVAVATEVEEFAMPGAGLPDFLRRSVLIAEAGIYDVRRHRDEVVVPLLSHWQALSRQASVAAATAAQASLRGSLVRLERAAQQQAQRRARRPATWPA